MLNAQVKSHDFAPISSAVDIMLHIAAETSMHVSYCAQFGVTLEELGSTRESPATTAYGAYLLDVGLQGDTTKLLIALAACLLGYGEVGLWLKREAAKPNSWVSWNSNPYRKWMKDYSGEAFQTAVSTGLSFSISCLTPHGADPYVKKPSSLERLWIHLRLFVQSGWWFGEGCVRLEKQFWDMAVNLS